MSFPMVALGEVIKHRNQFIQIDDLENYKRCRVQLHAQGIVLRDIVLGAEIKTKKQQFCRTGDFLVAEIDAKVGGFGIVPPELHDSIVSSHYFLFVIDETRLNRRFLDYFIRTPYFCEQVTAQGSTNYAAIRPANVLSYKIPLPPLAEQRRIVARIEELAAKIEEARGLRKKVGEEIEALIASVLSSILKPSYSEKTRLLDDYIVDIRYGTSEKCSDEEIGPAVLRMGNIQNGQIRFSQLKYLEPENIEPDLYLGKGDILFNRTNSAELVGKCGIFESDLKCTFASYLIRVRLDVNRAIPKLVAFYINSPLGRKYITSEIKQQCGQANVNSKKLKKMPIVLPPLPEQRRIVAYLDELQAKVDALRRLQAETGAEMDALMPAVLDKAFKGEI
ncbi:MAG: restriction endonuclease subunit S [Candidatus Methanoperedens sp.]|nr:restriction endonuclease subunit S [Candidatus Methanoperedens sp.]